MRNRKMCQIRKAACLLSVAALGLAQADDLPWKFEGNTLRDASFCVASQLTGLSSLRWSADRASLNDVLDSFSTSRQTSPGTSLLSMRLGFLLFLR